MVVTYIISHNLIKNVTYIRVTLLFVFIAYGLD